MSDGSLVLGNAGEVVEEFVWTVKTWMGVQFVRRTVKSTAARALAEMDWQEDQFKDVLPTFALQQHAEEQVNELVTRMIELGAGRREFSLASKVLHWLLPSRVPVYDSFVRGTLRIPSEWDHSVAYSSIVAWEFQVARELTQKDPRWVGDLEPMSPLRAVDKYLWWKGGGDRGTAMVVKDPWKIVRQLGLSTS